MRQTSVITIVPTAAAAAADRAHRPISVDRQAVATPLVHHALIPFMIQLCRVGGASSQSVGHFRTVAFSKVGRRQSVDSQHSHTSNAPTVYSCMPRLCESIRDMEIVTLRSGKTVHSRGFTVSQSFNIYMSGGYLWHLGG